MGTRHSFIREGLFSCIRPSEAYHHSLPPSPNPSTMTDTKEALEGTEMVVTSSKLEQENKESTEADSGNIQKYCLPSH